MIYHSNNDIINGASMLRNMFLFTNANYLLPYTGAGSGVRRALEYDPNVIFSNGVNQWEITHFANEFIITIPRKSEQVTDQAQLEIDPASPKSEQPHSKTDQAQQKTDPVNDQALGNTDPAQQNTDPVGDQALRKTDPAQQKTDPVGDQALGKTDPVSEQPTQNTTNLSKNTDQETDQVAHNTDPASPKSEQPTDQTAQNTTKLAHIADPASPKSEQPHIKLSQKQKDIRNFCSIPRTAKEILNRLGLSDFYNNRKRYIYDLVEVGVLERTIPNKPNDPNQKYRRKQ